MNESDGASLRHHFIANMNFLRKNLKRKKERIASTYLARAIYPLADPWRSLKVGHSAMGIHAV